MRVSAVGFLFQNKIKGKGLNNTNYTCTIHKQIGNGQYRRNTISSPIINYSKVDYVEPSEFREDLVSSLQMITDSKSKEKFVGATIKDGAKETEIHSVLSDDLYAIRTKDSDGRNHFRLANKNDTKKILSKNLYLTA